MLAMPRLLLPSVPPSAGQPIVAGWAYQWIAQLSLDRDSWTAPVDAARLHPLETPTSRPPRRSMGCWASAGRRGGAAVRIRWRLRLRPAQLRPHPGADGRTGAATRQPLLLFRPAGSPAWPRGPTAAPGRQVQLGRPDYLANPHRHARNHPRPVRHRDRAGLGRAASKQQRHPGHGSRGPRPVVGGTILCVQVERVPAKTRPPKVLWLWWAGPGSCDLDLAWRAYVRRFELEIVCTQVTKPGLGAVVGGGDHIADLDVAVGDHDSVDQQLDQLAPLLEAGLVKAHPQLLQHCCHRLGDRAHLYQPLTLGGDLPLAGQQVGLLPGKALVLALEAGQVDDL